MKKSFSNSQDHIEDNKRLHISARISSHEIKEEDSFLGDKYVIYKVNLSTFYKNWMVGKRYSDFETLHKALEGKIGDLPEFPPKRYFKNSDSTIKERKTKLENYLNYLFKRVNICSFSEIMDFVEMDKDLLLLLMKSNTMIESKTSVAVKRYYSMKKNTFSDGSVKKAKSVDNLNICGENYYSSFLDFKRQEKNSTGEKSMNMMVVEEFLRNLDFKCENKCDVIKTFEQFLKNKKSWPNFRREEINKLLFGETPLYSSNISNNSLDSDENSTSSIGSGKMYLKGLLYHIGNVEQNSLGAETCLEFLGKLIDYEYNPDCEAYIYILKTAKIEQLHSMRLNDHIRSGKFNIVKIAFRIIRAIVSEDRSMETKLRKLVNEQAIIGKFINWIEVERDNIAY